MLNRMRYRSGTQFNFELRPSRYFFTLISGLHLIILLLSVICDLRWWMLIIVMLVIMLSYGYLLYKYIYRKTKYSIIGLWQKEHDLNPCHWQLQFANKRIVNVELKPKGYLSDYLIIMHFKLRRKHQYGKIFAFLQYKSLPVIIFPDMIDYASYVALKRFLLSY